MRLSIWFLLVACSGVADAQAFGVAPGKPISQYSGKPIQGDPYYYEIKVPEPNNEFESYTAVATPRTGVCKVTGIGRTHQNDDYGSDTRSSFTSLRGRLSQRYGSSHDFDFLRSGAIWKESREWVWSIYKHERTLASFWVPSEGATLPAPLRAVTLEAKSVNPSSGAYLTLTYEFDNFDACKAVIGDGNDAGL